MADQVVLLQDRTSANGVSATQETAFNGAVTALVRSSTTAARPSVTAVGMMVFDTTLGKPIWWNGAVWKDATGTTV